MPPAKGSNPFGDRLNKATQSHATDETKYGSGGELSPNVSGRASLVKVEMGKVKADAKKNAGADYVLFTGIATSPQSEEGKRVSKLIVLADEPKSTKKPNWVPPTLEDRAAEALNIMRILGGPDITARMATEPNPFPREWIAVCEALTTAAPDFLWHTWLNRDDKAKLAKDPNAQVYVNLQIDRAITGEAAAAASSGSDSVQDNTGNEAGDNGSTDETDWTALGEAADGGDTEARSRLDEKAAELDCVDEYSKTSDYAAGAALLLEKMNGGSSGEGEGDSSGDDAKWTPGKDEEYDLKIAKHGDKAKVKYVILSEKGGKVNLKRVKDKKEFKGVAWGNDPDQIGGSEV